MKKIVEKDFFNDIESFIQDSKIKLNDQINHSLLFIYWEIGRKIYIQEQLDKTNINYGKELITKLSQKLTNKYGKGFSRSNVFNMRRFYSCYPDFESISKKLGWSHYAELISISDECKRKFYEVETQNSKWSVRELKRQIDTSLYERLLLSKGKENKQIVYELALKGQEIKKSSDIIRDPYVFEFLGIKEDKPILESDLEKSLIKHIGEFLLELGKGFMYVGSQQRVTIANTNYFVDLVFYNKILRSYVLIELKTTKLMPEAVGQLNMYLNYYKQEINDKNDNDPIGIILCTEKDEIQAEYALGGMSNKIFASKYHLYIPDKEMLELEAKKVIDAFNNKNKK